MPDPCEPPSLLPAHRHVHHAHPARIIGRVRRHGTARVAHHLNVYRNACLPGSMTVLRSAVLKTALPVATFAALHTDSSTVTPDPSTWQGSEAPGGLSLQAGGTGAGSEHARPYPAHIPEPASLGMLLLALFAWLGWRGLAAGRLRVRTG